MKNINRRIKIWGKSSSDSIEGSMTDIRNSAQGANILDGLTLKDEFSKEELIKIILNYSDYLLANKNELTEDCLNQQMVTFIKILFYGAINSKED